MHPSAVKTAAIPNIENGARASIFFIKHRGKSATMAIMIRHSGMDKYKPKPLSVNLKDCDKMAELANNPMSGSSVVAMATQMPPLVPTVRSQHSR
eukprot:scaffold42561_cov183-Amphora_coffeaeformis.AAC.1